jgi:hypothetical protein
MARRTRIYVGFDADEDIHIYRLLQAWDAHDRFDLDLPNAHELTNIWHGSSEETIKRHLRERMDNAKMFVLLVGEKTHGLRKYVPYEIGLAVKADIPIVVVNLNKKRVYDSARTPASIDTELAIHIGFYHKVLKYALEHWPAIHLNHRSKGETGPWYYKPETYSSLGIPSETELTMEVYR